MYTLKTYDISDVWGGEITYNPAHISQFNAALTDFTANNQDSRAAIIAGYRFIAGTIPTAISLSLFYDGPTPPAHVFAAFMAIPHLSDTSKTQRYPELLNIPATSDVGLRTSNAVNSFPNMPPTNMTSFLDWHWNMSSGVPFMISPSACSIQLFSMAVQPISVGLQRASTVSGQGALTLDPANGDKVWIEYDVGWTNSTSRCEVQCPQQLIQVTERALAYQKQVFAGVKPTHYESGDLSIVP
jgi:hypothetical protein